MTTRRSPRRRWISVRLTARDVAHDLEQRHSLRWHGLCIGTLTLLGMLLAAWLQKQAGVHLLSVRYAITLAVGYGIYLLVLRWWAARLLMTRRSAAAPMRAMPWMWRWTWPIWPAQCPAVAAPAAPEMPRMSDVADSAESGKGLGDLASGALDGLGGADEGAVVIIPVVAIFLIGAAILAGAGALAMLFFSWDVLLAVAVELAFSVAAVRVATRVEREGWLTAAVRLTWKPLLGALLCAVLLGATIDHFLPQVDSLPEAVRMLQGG